MMGIFELCSILSLVVVLSRGEKNESSTRNPETTLPKTEYRKPTSNILIVLSFDGFSNDFLRKRNDSNACECNFLRGLLVEKDSYSPTEGMMSVDSVPASTVVSHWAIATGLQPTVNGIWNTEMYDPKLQPKHFTALTAEHEWWDIAKPIWEDDIFLPASSGDSKHKPLCATIRQWPGTHSELPVPRSQVETVWLENRTTNRDVLKQVLAETVKDVSQGKQLVMNYFEEPAFTAGKHGFGSPELKTVLEDIDSALGTFWADIKASGYFGDANIVVLSGNGMLPVNESKIQDVKQLYLHYEPSFILEMEKVAPIVGTYIGMWPKDGRTKKRFEDVVNNKNSLTEPLVDGVVFDEANVTAFSARVQSRMPPYYFHSTEKALLNFDLHLYPHYVFPKAHDGFDKKFPEMRALLIGSGSTISAILRKKFSNGKQISVTDLYPIFYQVLTGVARGPKGLRGPYQTYPVKNISCSREPSVIGTTLPDGGVRTGSTGSLATGSTRQDRSDETHPGNGGCRAVFCIVIVLLWLGIMVL